MDPNAKKKLIGAIVAAALAIAVYYGLIDQKQANSIQTQTDQTLGTGPATQQPTSQQPTNQQPANQPPMTQQPAPQPPPSPTAPTAPSAPPR